MMARHIGYSYFYEDHKTCEKHFINAPLDDIDSQKLIYEMSYIKLTTIVSLWIDYDG
jgi:hypothetical protein